MSTSQGRTDGKTQGGSRQDPQFPGGAFEVPKRGTSDVNNTPPSLAPFIQGAAGGIVTKSVDGHNQIPWPTTSRLEALKKSSSQEKKQPNSNSVQSGNLVEQTWANKPETSASPIPPPTESLENNTPNTPETFIGGNPEKPEEKLTTPEELKKKNPAERFWARRKKQEPVTVGLRKTLEKASKNPFQLQEIAEEIRAKALKEDQAA